MRRPAPLTLAPVPDSAPHQPGQAHQQRRDDDQRRPAQGKRLQPHRQRLRHGRRDAGPARQQAVAEQETRRRGQPGPLPGADARHHGKHAAAVDQGAQPEQDPADCRMPVQRIAHRQVRQTPQRTQHNEPAEHPQRGFQQRPQPRPAAPLDQLFQGRHRAGTAALDGVSHQQRQCHARHYAHTLRSFPVVPTAPRPGCRRHATRRPGIIPRAAFSLLDSQPLAALQRRSPGRRSLAITQADSA
ncbi:hypothetical protein D3C85_905570 [compost metagenome]